MLNRFARATFTRLFTPAARLLLRLGVSPDAVTVVGTMGVCLSALWFFPQGEFLWGALAVTAVIFADTIDGIMARMSNRSTRWGAFLDSTLDRLADGAVFGGIVIYYARASESAFHLAVLCAALACLVLGSVVSYARARAEGLGLTAAVGIAERADRLVLVLAATGLVGLKWTTGFGLPESTLLIVLIVLVIASAVTVIQRMLVVREQTREEVLASKVSHA